MRNNKQLKWSGVEISQFSNSVGWGVALGLALYLTCVCSVLIGEAAVFEVAALQPHHLYKILFRAFVTIITVLNV